MGTSSKAVLFFLSYFEALQDLKPMQQLEAYNAIFQYAFCGTEPKLSKTVKPLWTLIKPTIDSSMKKRADGSKGGRNKETTGSNDEETSGLKNAETTGSNDEETSGLKNAETTGSADSSSNKEKDKDKETDKDKGKGIPGASLPGRSLKRKKTSPTEPVFQSLPSETSRIGCAGTEELKKRQIPKIEKAAEQIAAQPQTQQEDTETAKLKKAFRQDRATEEPPTPAEYAQPPPG